MKGNANHLSLYTPYPCHGLESPTFNTLKKAKQHIKDNVRRYCSEVLEDGRGLAQIEIYKRNVALDVRDYVIPKKAMPIDDPLTW